MMRNKKQKLFAGLASLTLFDLAAAGAADAPIKAPVRMEPPAIYSWTGPYIGAHAGYRWADAVFSAPENGTSPARQEKFSLDGGIVGVHFGYNLLVTSNILAGIEGDWTWGSTSRSSEFPTLDGFALSTVKLGWQATIRGRLGLVDGSWLYYITSGVAFTRVNWSNSQSFNDFVARWSYNSTRPGWVLGGGIEHMVTQNWLIRVEYLYENFNVFNVPHGLSGEIGTLEIEDVHKVRFGISYKFGGPLVARY